MIAYYYVSLPCADVIHSRLLKNTSGILQIETLAEVDANLEDCRGEDSEINKNLEICDLEKRDFDDEKGME
jgi:hypothetical protein